MRALVLLLSLCAASLGAAGAAGAARRAPASAPSSVPVNDEHKLSDALAAAAFASYDSARGGFVSKKGIPDDAAVELGLELASDGRPGWAERTLATIRWMRILRDTVVGGYFSGEREIGVASWFQKPTGCNSRRLEQLITAWKWSGRAEYQADAAHLADFFDRVLLDGRGGFASGQSGGHDLEPAANGYAIHAWLTWSAVNGNKVYRDFALRSIDRVWNTCWSPKFGLLRRDAFGALLSAPKLDDQVEMGRALLLAAHLGRRDADRARAKAIGELLLGLFEDKTNGGFLTKVVVKKDGKIAKAQREPGENARAARFLCELSAQTHDARYLEAARRTWRAFAESFEKPGEDAAEWALAVRASFDHDLPVWATREEPEPEPAKPSVVRIRRSR